jgi:hypothetical protein
MLLFGLVCGLLTLLRGGTQGIRHLGRWIIQGVRRTPRHERASQTESVQDKPSQETARIYRMSLTLATMAFLLGLATLVGYLTTTEILYAPLADMPGMAPNTALGFLFLAGGLVAGLVWGRMQLARLDTKIQTQVGIIASVLVQGSVPQTPTPTPEE